MKRNGQLLTMLVTESCTIAIVNLGAFRPGEVPNLDPNRRFPRTDVGSYDDIVRNLSLLSLLNIAPI